MMHVHGKSPEAFELVASLKRHSVVTSGTRVLCYIAYGLYSLIHSKSEDCLDTRLKEFVRVTNLNLFNMGLTYVSLSLDDIFLPRSMPKSDGTCANHLYNFSMTVTVGSDVYILTRTNLANILREYNVMDTPPDGWICS